MLQKLAKIALTTFLYIVAFDVVGVVAAFVLDVFPSRRKSDFTFYAIWLVLGAFCGFLAYQSGAQSASTGPETEWTDRADAPQAGRFALAGTALLLIAITTVSYLTMWKRGVQDSFFVPDDTVSTLVFFIAMFLAMLIAHRAFVPDRKKL